MATQSTSLAPNTDQTPQEDTPLVPGQDPTPWTPPTWDELVREHADRVYRLAYRLSGNQHDAEDLTQETFIRVFRSEEHTSELQSRGHLVCRLLREKKTNITAAKQ